MDQDRAIAAFAALAQPTRMQVYRLLVAEGPGGLTASAIAERLGVVPSTLSGHLARLRDAGLLRDRRQHREIHYAADLEQVNALVGFLLSECCGGRVENCREVLTLLRVDDG